MATETYFVDDWNVGVPQDPKTRGLMGMLRRFFGGWAGPQVKNPAVVYVEKEKVLSGPDSVRLPWFLPYDECDTGTGETQAMRQMYRRMIAWAPVKAALQNKIFGVAALKLQIHPADKRNDLDQKIAEGVRWNLIRRLKGSIPALVWKILSAACVDGYSVNEKIWNLQEAGKYAGRIALTNLKQKDTGYDIVPKTDQFNNITSFLGLRYNGGKEFHPSDFVTFAHLPMYERPTGTSDLRAAYSATWLYDTAWKLRRIGLTTKSFPLLWAQYEKESQQPSINTALAKAKSLSFLTVPKGTMVEALEIAGSSADEFHSTIQDLREEILMCITGAFMHQMGGGQNVRRGSSEKAESISDLFKWFLSECICGLLNDEETGIIKEIVDLNHVVSEYPYASLDAVSWEEMKNLADIVGSAREWGMPLSKEWIYEKFSLEAPHKNEDGDETEDTLEPEAPPPAPIMPGTKPPFGGPDLPPEATTPAPPPNKGGTGGSPIDTQPHKFAEGDKGKWEPAVEMGHRGGLKGGPARAKKLTPLERHRIAVQGGKARQGVQEHADAGSVNVLTAHPKKEDFAAHDVSGEARGSDGKWTGGSAAGKKSHELTQHEFGNAVEERAAHHKAKGATADEAFEKALHEGGGSWKKQVAGAAEKGEKIPEHVKMAYEAKYGQLPDREVETKATPKIADSPTVTPVTVGAARHVADAVKAVAGDTGLAPLHKVREELAKRGITDRAAQDAAIHAARGTHVSASNLEGRQGISPEERAAAIPEAGGNLGFLSLIHKHSEWGEYT